MNATKTSFQLIDSAFVEWQANGSIPALKWVDAAGNNWRAMASYEFECTAEVYTILVKKYVQLVGTTDWILAVIYPITADSSKYRILATGALVPDPTGIPEALDALGNVVDINGWVYNSKFFTMMIGYNTFSQIVSINYWVYLEIADREGLTII